MKFLAIAILFLFSIHTSAQRGKPSFNYVTIDSLKPGMKYLINVESIGCFHHSTMDLTIERNGIEYFATFKISGIIETAKVKHTNKRVKLSLAQLDSVRKFEKELVKISMRNDGCTTVDSYSLKIGPARSFFKDDSCEWRGISKLVADLFNERKNL